MTADAGGVGAPRFDVVLRGYDRRQVDEHVARLQRVMSRMRADLELVRSQPIPVVQGPPPGYGRPGPGQPGQPPPGAPRPAPRPRPDEPDMIGSFTDRMQSILQAAEEEAAEIRNKARAGARAETESVRAELADLVRQRDAVLHELTRLRGQLEGMLHAPTGRMAAAPRDGANPRQSPAGPGAAPGGSQGGAKPVPGSERPAAANAPKPRPGPAPAGPPQAPGQQSPGQQPGAAQPHGQPGRPQPAAAHSSAQHSSATQQSSAQQPPAGGKTPSPAGSPQSGPARPGQPPQGPSGPPQAGAPRVAPPVSGQSPSGPKAPSGPPSSGQNAAGQNPPPQNHAAQSKPSQSKPGQNGSAQNGSAQNGSAQKGSAQKGSGPSGSPPAGQQGGASRGRPTVASPVPPGGDSGRTSEAGKQVKAAHRLPTGAYPAVGEQASMRPRSEPEPEPADLFRPLAQPGREAPAAKKEPSDKPGDVEATMKVGPVRPSAPSDATVVAPAVKPPEKKDTKPDAKGEGAGAPDRSTSTSRSG
ncbi:MAG: hypothetical protein J0I49_29270 [Pseudonocardia sp.]|uniref:hypothetical protein n=1 Tax=Pseudonocardia sp. TaxID=60912 RepID=UPI001AD17E59|nr:hypothetical protein [Pseudonocardia sp.]MBN9102155.1 hypothetical protein [Pseudonocardia sp.]